MERKKSDRMQKKAPVVASDPPLFKRRRGTRPIGPFAHLVMQTIVKLNQEGDDQSYGLNIDEVLTNKLRAIVDLAQIYVVLKRLDKRGFLKSRKVRAPSGSGHTVTVYTVTDAGAEAMRQAALFYNQLYQGDVPAQKEEVNAANQLQRRGRARRSPSGTGS